MYTILNLQQKLEEAKDNLREVEDHLQKVDGKPLSNATLRFQKPEFRQIRNWGNFNQDDGNNEENIKAERLLGRKVLGNVLDDGHKKGSDGRRRHVSLSTDEPLQRKRLFPSVGNDDTSPVRKKAFQSVVGKVQLPDLSIALKRGRERREREKDDDETAINNPRPRNVFSRLSGPSEDPNELDEDDDDDDDEIIMKRQPAILSKVEAIERPTPSREQVIANQKQDEARKQRDRRMFGALVGTLQQFRRDETKVKQRDERRLQIEKKLEEDAIKEKEKLIEEKRQLQVERKRRESDIKRIEWSLNRVKEFDAWQNCMLPLKNFIQTKCEPKIFYLPKVMTPQSEKLVEDTAIAVQDLIDKRLASLNDEIESSERKAKILAGEESDLNKENEEVLTEPKNEAIVEDDGNFNEDHLDEVINDYQKRSELEEVEFNVAEGKPKDDVVEEASDIVAPIKNRTSDISKVGDVEKACGDQLFPLGQNASVELEQDIPLPTTPDKAEKVVEPSSKSSQNSTPYVNENVSSKIKKTSPTTSSANGAAAESASRSVPASPKSDSRKSNNDGVKSRSPTPSREGKGITKEKGSKSASRRRRSRSRSDRKKSRSPRRSRSRSKSRRKSPRRSSSRHRRRSPKRRASPRRRSPDVKSRLGRREEPKKRTGRRSSSSRSRSKSNSSSSSDSD